MFELDPRLERDTHPIGWFKLCRVLLMNDANYPWFLLVPERANIREIFELTEDDQERLMLESCLLSRSICDVFKADKINVAALGNVVEQLHVHHVVRYRTDAAWPAPVWGRASRPYPEEELNSIRDTVARALSTVLTLHY